ncbi:ABC-type branched-subunit amino acid transport system permease subunit [Jatrophihabitans sp. GAS493]|uniref:branched-chain amino acid ABC transporter permease n=1 Tax=Jatrophihabitans sp. GAS493 TaxID=1907575 RepID=UPI000BB95675|nr:branched-chain amino acid ABC transporter permease [Jatrophihabitans sp. GAS493]SOD73449.1 ABC-type branched-subunit amino acid transport system permease subunit [Jatrophihabitans sp. GAS493]
MIRRYNNSPFAQRLVACVAGSLVLALMWGPQEGVQEDYGYAFRQAVLKPRVFVFIALGVGACVLITYWPRIRPYLGRPGVSPTFVGGLTVVASYTLLQWDSQIGNGKLGTVNTAISSADGISPLAAAFYGWLHWVLFLVTFVVAAAATMRRIAILAWVGAGLALVSGVIAFYAHSLAVEFTGSDDHSFGAVGALIGFLTIAVACATSALSPNQVARGRAVFSQLLDWRPGLLVAAAGTLAGLLSFSSNTWIAPQGVNATFSDTYALFEGSDLSAVALAYLQWLGWALFFVTAVVSLVACYLRLRWLGWIGAVLGIVSVVLTLLTLNRISTLAPSLNIVGSTGPWQNLGAGGWFACFAFSLLAAGAAVAATTPGLEKTRLPSGAPASKAGQTAAAMGQRIGSTNKSLILIGIAIALFYPPTMTDFWQKVLVTEIGVYVLLAVGLNVVVGWAGLLDLGFIAFYAIGSYTTAYLVGSLPHKPPSWLHMTPLLAIPFAVGVCLLAGLALGAPTLRLRGDYLAIVTLGFGEIIRIAAINNPFNLTNSTRGPSPTVPHPVIHMGPLSIKWGLNNLQYWYLLLVIIIIVVVLFYRLEGSRIGRAWAAIREDEIAAQASGINTTRVKLLAFAIGASTSGITGVFFASQVGYFNPDNFVLNNSILVVAYVVFGGMGSLAGAMAGAAVLTWLPEFLKDQVPADDRQMWIGAILLLMMIFRPAGLLPAKRRKAELSGFGVAASSETRAVPVSEGL